MRRVALFLALFSLFAWGSSEAAISEHLAVRALVGEAGGQGNEEITAHAFAIRNRGSLRGVYGLHAKHTASEPGWVFQRAARAWQAACDAKYPSEDPIAGRTEWRSKYDLKLMAQRGQTPTSCGLYDPLKIGDTTFYRLRRTK